MPQHHVVHSGLHEKTRKEQILKNTSANHLHLVPKATACFGEIIQKVFTPIGLSIMSHYVIDESIKQNMQHNFIQWIKRRVMSNQIKKN